MKRAVIFLIVLCLILVVIVSTEFFYSKNLKKHTNEIIKDCETDCNFSLCAEQLRSIMANRKIINRLFYSKNIIKKIESEIDKLEIYAIENQKSDAKVQLKNIKFLYHTLFRFNANEG